MLSVNMASPVWLFLSITSVNETSGELEAILEPQSFLSLLWELEIKTVVVA